MTRRQPGVTRTLYLTHWEHPDGHVWHYSGVTELHNLTLRIRMLGKHKSFQRPLRASERGFKCIHHQHEILADPWREKAMFYEPVAQMVCEMCHVRAKIEPDTHGSSAPLETFTLADLRRMNFEPRYTRWK